MHEQVYDTSRYLNLRLGKNQTGQTFFLDYLN